MQPSDISSLADLETLYRQWGWIGLASGVVFGLLKLWRSGLVDSWLNAAFPRMQWDARSRWWKLGTVFVLSTAATTFTGIMSGQAVWAAAIGGVLAALGAIGMHETGKTMGKAVAESRVMAEVGREGQSIRTKLDDPR
jgi:hypothetical protein